MGVLVFWLVIGLLVIVLIGLVIRLGIPYLLGKLGKGASRRSEEKFRNEFLSAPASDEKVQGRMNLLFYGRWVMQILGILLAALPLVILIREGSMNLDEILPYLLLGGLGVLLFIGGRLLARNTKRLVQLVVKPLLQEVFGDNMEYDAFSHIPDECIKSSGFFDNYEDISGSDFIKGQYKGIPVMLSDVSLTRTDYDYDSDTGKRTEQVVILFRGFWMVADFDRELTAVPLSILEKRGGSDAIKMESEAFNQQFGVFCPDPHTAFYILTPHFMERLIAVDRAANGKSCFKFAGNRLQIAVGTKHDLFEADKWRAPNVKKMKESFQQEIGNTTSVLDELLKNERLFGRNTAPANEEG